MIATSPIAERLSLLRQQLEAGGLDALLVPTEDPHQSEYLPTCYDRRPFISGFDGSAGTAMVGREHAWLVADSRYWIQAERQLDDGLYTLGRLGSKDVPDGDAWLVGQLERGQVLGVDGRTLNLRRERTLRRLADKNGIELRLLEENPIDASWADQPSRPDAALQVLSEDFAGESVADKLQRVRTRLAEESCSATVVTTLDQVAWLFNLRGRDVEYNPVFLSYAVITEDGCSLHVDESKVTDEVRQALPEGVTLRSYEAFGDALQEVNDQGLPTWVDPKTCSAWVRDQLGSCSLYEATHPVELFKAAKNDTEVDGIRACHVRDGAALTRFLYWLDRQVAAGNEVTELTAADRLEAFRREGEHFQGLSFPSISAFASHGALPHYRPLPDEEGHRPIDTSSLYLLDSGAQYLDGTTDVTRTVCFAEPTADQVARFTEVLRGHVALARVRFPRRTDGKQLDILARLPLWETGHDYGHGTGHGVGAYLNVHEGPQGISTRGTDVPLQPGMVLSNEPGYYLEGDFGIRTENLVVVTECDDHGQDDNDFLCFETVTLAPIDRRLIDVDRLLPAEREWLDEYHARVREQLSPFMNDEERSWLEQVTAPL